MSRILAGAEMYEPVSSSSLYESEYEQLVLQHSDKLFSGYHTVEFKKTVTSEEGSSQADLALIHRRYREWWIVEVERSEHSLASHVLPQMLRLTRASYGEDEASYLCKTEPHLDSRRVETMMKGSPPNALVIVNEPMPKWHQPLQHLDVMLGVFQVYRSNRNSHLYSIKGDYPDPPGQIVSRCRCAPSLQRLVEIDSPAARIIDEQDNLSILFEGNVTEWSKLETADSVFLHPIRTNPLSPKTEYSIVMTDSGRLRFEK